MKERKEKIIRSSTIGLYFVFIIVSLLINYRPGVEIAINLKAFLLGMIKVFPAAFILIGLFEVWVKNETVQKHLGEKSGLTGHFWALVLAATTVGGLFISFPLAYTLHKKGAKLSVIFTYISAAGICRVPMTIFEASYLGAKFSCVRFIVSLPLLLIFSCIIAKYFCNSNYEIMEGKN